MFLYIDTFRSFVVAAYIFFHIFSSFFSRRYYLVILCFFCSFIFFLFNSTERMKIEIQMWYVQRLHVRFNIFSLHIFVLYAALNFAFIYLLYFFSVHLFFFCSFLCVCYALVQLDTGSVIFIGITSFLFDLW